MIPLIPGGGLTRRILSSFPAGWKIPTASLLQFVLEGDNRVDAGLLASVVIKVINKDIAQWRQPGSWRDGLFGTPHDQTLYG
jgi:proteasome assembly chaperone 2